MAETRHEWLLNQIFRYRAALRRRLRKLTPDAEDIEDLIQEIHLRVYSLPGYDGVNSPRALLFKIADDLCIERARCRNSQASGDLGNAMTVHSPAAADVPLDERRRFEAFCAAVDQLPPLCRRVFLLRKVYRLSHDEIAEILCISHSTIEKHVAKGLLHCRDYLKRAGLHDPDELRPSSRPTRLRDRKDLE